LAKTSIECRLFDKWSFEQVEVKDPGLAQVVSLKPVKIPHSREGMRGRSSGSIL